MFTPSDRMIGTPQLISSFQQPSHSRVNPPPPPHPPVDLFEYEFFKYLFYMFSQYEFDVLIGADGKRNTLAGIYFIFF